RKRAALAARAARSCRLVEQLRWDVVWPAPAVPTCGEEWTLARHVGDSDTAGRWYSPKLRREVEYESLAERRLYQQADLAEDVAWYQEQPCAIPYFHNGRRRLYYPDALLGLVDGSAVLVEVKPPFQMALAQNLSKWDAAL